MLINLSNHPSAKWAEEQLRAGHEFGEIADLPFPTVDPNGDEKYIQGLAEEYSRRILDLANGHQTTVHLMGEMTLTFAIASRLMEKGIRCVAATTERIVTESPGGAKTTFFKFVRFRYYA